MQKTFIIAWMLASAAGSAAAQATHTSHTTKAHPPAAHKPAPPFWVSYRDALVRATETHGLVFIHRGTALGGDKVLKEKLLLDSLKAGCVAGVDLAPTDTTLGDAVFAYVLADGKPVYRYTGNPTRVTYLDGLRQAQARRDGIYRLRLLEAERLLGDKDEDKLEGIIAERNVEGLPADSLLELYVEALPKDSVQSLRVLRFLALQSPLLNSEANQLLRQDATLFNLVWQRLTIQERIHINNEVIAKTRAKAVVDQDEQEATLAATFAANTNNGPTAKVRAFQGVMLEFYYGVADTNHFLQIAGTYYDRFLMPINADSLRRQDSLYHREWDLSVARFVGTQLETGARRVQRMTSDSTLLSQAKAWADKAKRLWP